MSTTYPTSIDSNSSISNTRVTNNTIPASDHNDVATALFAVEAKLGVGTSTAASATSGTVLTRNSDGTTGWVAPSAGGATTLSGDITGSGTSAITTTLSASGVTAGTYTNATITVDAKGRVTSASIGAIPPARRVTTGVFSTSVTPNCDTTDIFALVLTGNTAFVVPSGTPVAGQKIEYHLIQDATGSRTVNWGTGYAFASTLTAPTLSTTPNAVDILAFEYSATASKWRFFGAITGF